MKTLNLIRGLPGSGKTTRAHELGAWVFEADDYFVDKDGVYRWKPELLSNAHESCLENCIRVMKQGTTPVSVSNTFVKREQMQPYLDAAKHYGYTDVNIYDCFDDGLTDMQLAHRNRHQVPLHTIVRMRKQYEP